MPGKHKFPSVPEGYVVRCEHCGESKSDLDKDKVDGRLPPCQEASDQHEAPGGLRLVDVESSIVICRTLLESQARHYISDHIRYVSNTKSAKCKHVMNTKTSVSEALDHMQCCAGQLESWKLFKTNSKLFTSAPGRSVYAALSESVHTAFVKENQVHIPEQLEPIPKRFLLRLFQALQYRVQVVDEYGNLRDAVPDELEAPNTTPQKASNPKKRRLSIGSESSSSTATSTWHKKSKKSSKAKKEKK